MVRRTLRQMNPGEKAHVVHVEFKGAVGRRLMEMGIVPGSRVEVERFAPLGDPVEIKVKGSHLSLRREEAELVEVSGEEKS